MLGKCRPRLQRIFLHSWQHVAIDHGERIDKQLRALSLVHEDVLEREVTFLDCKERDICRAAWFERTKVWSSHCRGRFGRCSLDHVGETHSEMQEFRQRDWHVEHRTLNRHLVDVGADHIRHHPLSQHFFGSIETERT